MGIPLQRGRLFSAIDDREGAGTAVVNETFAERHWPDGSALGKTLTYGGRENQQAFEIVGVVADLAYYQLGERRRPFVYLPHAQNPLGGTVLHLKSALGSETVVQSAKELVAGLDPGLPVYNTNDLETLISVSLWQQRMLASLITLFGGLALVLGATGVYGVVAYGVSRRTAEVGIRMALGADAARVRRLFLRGSTITLGLGLAIGIGAALAVGQAVSGLLFGVRPADPLVIGAASGLLSIAALAAASVPVRRATAVDPVSALKQD